MNYPLYFIKINNACEQKLNYNLIKNITYSRAHRYRRPALSPAPPTRQVDIPDAPPLVPLRLTSYPPPPLLSPPPPRFGELSPAYPLATPGRSSHGRQPMLVRLVLGSRSHWHTGRGAGLRRRGVPLRASGARGPARGPARDVGFTDSDYPYLKFTLATITMVSCPRQQSSDGFILTPTTHNQG